MSGGPSYEELAGLVAAQAGLIGRLEAQVVALGSRVAVLEEENAELRRRLGLDSTNSSRPPSTDGLEKVRVGSLRRRTGRRPGGQAGALGRTLLQVPDPQVRREHRPDRCAGCGKSLADDAPRVGRPVVRQVFDLPEIVVQVTEHRMLAVKCACGQVTRAPAPVGVQGPTSLGPGLVAVAAYLCGAQMIPLERVARTIEALFGIGVSTGWVSAALARTHTAVQESAAGVRAAIAVAPVVHFDESVTTVAGKRAWFHLAATENLTAYWADEHGRGLEAMKAFGILPGFTGIAVHDAYAAYYSARLECQATHALCVAHVQRELRAVAEHDPAARAEGWAQAADDLIGDMLRWRGTYQAKGHRRLADFKLEKVRRRWEELLERALALHPHRPGSQTHARRLALRMSEHKDDYLRHLTDFTIPPTNNLAERAVRMIKTKTKVSGGFRTLDGLRQFLALRGYIDTLRKNHQHILTGLRNALNGQAWTPA